MAKKLKYPKAVEAARAVLGDSTLDDEERRSRRIIREAAKEGRTCAKCGQKLKPGAPVWRQRIGLGHGFFGGWRIAVAPICKKCHAKEEKFDREYGLRTRYEDAKPCEGCGRPVHYKMDHIYRQHSFCSEVCQSKVLSATATAAARQQRAEARGTRTCENCDKIFTPTRTDVRFCSAACKQRAYRRRVTANKKRLGQHFKNRNGRPLRLTKKAHGAPTCYPFQTPSCFALTD
jgi:hypothetical protein